MVEDHKELSPESADGVKNAVAIRTYLQLQGREAPYSTHDLDNAYCALSDTGALLINNSVKPAPVKDPGEEFISPLDFQTHELRRIERGGNFGF